MTDPRDNPTRTFYPEKLNARFDLTRVIALLGVLFATHAHAGWQPPLTEAELAQTTDIVTNVKPEHLRRSSTQDLHPLGKQILLIELREQKNKSDNGVRVAEIFAFDYHRQTSELHLVDVTRDVLLSSTDIESPHLPLSDAEISYSQSLVWADSNVNSLVGQEILRLQDLSAQTQGQSTRQSTQQTDTQSTIQSRVAIWVPDTPSHAGISGCDFQRCALLSLFTNTEQSLTVEPVVNLITGIVYTNLFP